ncbi:MAG: hypothetical protein ABIB79_00870 [archaeon]
MSEYSINEIYQGGVSSLSPSYGDNFIGYHMGVGDISLSTDPRTANILQEASSKLSTGVKQIEISAISEKILGAISQQHLKELNRLSKLTGVEMSFHGPMEEPSGLTQNGFNEQEREKVEKQFNQAVERSHEINPDGNMPVTFHASVLPFSKPVPKDKENLDEIYIIDTDTGGFGKIPLKERQFPGQEGPVDVKKEINEENDKLWTQKKSNFSYYADFGTKAVEKSAAAVKAIKAEEKAGNKITEDMKDAKASFSHGSMLVDQSYRNLRELYETVSKKGSDTDKQILRQFSDDIKPHIDHIKNSKDNVDIVVEKKNIVEKGIEVFSKISAPQVFRPIDDFAREKTAETFGNVAVNAYKEFGNKAPIISIENHPAGDAAFTTGKELKQVVEESRKKFVEKATKSKREDGLGISKAKAEQIAEKIIGATLDVGHLNMLRRYGYKEEDIVEEAKEVSPFVKHVHLSDNFGFEHTELPMGMGNVPIKEILENLPDKDIKKVIEAGDWFQHFKTPPVVETLEAFGSPIYAMKMQPYWNQTLGYQQDWYPGLGAIYPEGNFQTFGGGFSQLSMELGGQRPGAQGARMSGRPME